MAEVAAVIPVYNDKKALETAIPESIRALSSVTHDFELIIAEDGSTDGSAGYVREWESKDPRVRLLHSDERLGRGRALNRAIGAATARVCCYYDVDLATGMEHLPQLVRAIRDEGYDLATGSRLMPGSDIVRSGKREIASRGFNFLVRLILGSSLYDHQCGFKGFNRERLLALIPEVRDNHWFWDTEVLVRGQKKGYRVLEFPVRWREGRGTTVRKNDVFKMFRAILRLWWQLHVS
jgi:glycosyltransferase involved in cell wall biosynthesis